MGYAAMRLTHSVRDLAQTAFSFIQLTDVFEDFTSSGRRFVLCGFVLSLTDQLAQVLAISLGVVSDEAVQYGVVTDQ